MSRISSGMSMAGNCYGSEGLVQNLFGANNPAGTFLKDLFAGSASTNLGSHSPDIGGAWSKDNYGLTQNDLLLVGDGTIGMANEGNGTYGYSNAVTPPSADYTIQADFKYQGGNEDIFLFGRTTTANPNTTSYSFGCVGAIAWKLRRGVTVLATQSVTLVSGTTYRLKFVISGTTLTGYVDGVQQVTATDSNIASAGRVCIYMGFGGATPLGSGNLYSNLYAYTG